MFKEGAISDKEFDELFKDTDSDNNKLIGMDGMQFLLLLLNIDDTSC